MINLLNSKEKRKINVLRNIISNEAWDCKGKNLYSIINELNFDFIENELDIQVVKHNDVYLLNNPLNIPEDIILHNLVNFYASTCTPFIFVDTLMDVYYDTQALKIDDIIEYFPMTRQNVYKLIERINKIIKEINIRLIPKNSEIFIEGELINTVLQCYRYFNLHYYQSKIYTDFDTFQRQLLEGLSVLRIDTKHRLLEGLFQFSNEINKETMFLKYLEDLGEVEEYKQTKWMEISTLPLPDIKIIEELYKFSKPYILDNYLNHSSTIKFDTLLIIILSELVPYKNFHSVFTNTKQKNRVKSMNSFLNANSKINVEEEYGLNFVNYIDLVSHAFSGFFKPIEIVFFIKSFKGRIFELMIEKFIRSNFNYRDISFTDKPINADIILSDFSTKDPRSVLIGNIDNLFNSRSYQLNIILKINQKIDLTKG